MQVVFVGTHHFAAQILEGIVENPLFDIVQVITQPDKPVGRKKLLTPPPVKTMAEQIGLSVEQPKTLRSYTLPESVDLVIVVQYGKIIPTHILETPTHGVINIHTSLLPQYRGASPIQSALIAGEQTTGVTIMKMDEGLDTGPILLQKELKIHPTETAPELSERLVPLSIQALLEAIPPYEAGTLTPLAQDKNQATTCSQLSREDGRIDWNSSAQKIYNQYRGMTPWPGVWTTHNEKRVKLLSIELLDSDLLLKPGEIAAGHTLVVGTGHGNLLITEIQLDGKKPMQVEEFLSGYKSQFDQQIFL